MERDPLSPSLSLSLSLSLTISLYLIPTISFVSLSLSLSISLSFPPFSNLSSSLYLSLSTSLFKSLSPPFLPCQSPSPSPSLLSLPSLDQIIMTPLELPRQMPAGERVHLSPSPACSPGPGGHAALEPSSSTAGHGRQAFLRLSRLLGHAVLSQETGAQRNQGFHLMG